MSTSSYTGVITPPCFPRARALQASSCEPLCLNQRCLTQPCKLPTAQRFLAAVGSWGLRFSPCSVRQAESPDVRVPSFFSFIPLRVAAAPVNCPSPSSGQKTSTHP